MLIITLMMALMNTFGTAKIQTLMKEMLWAVIAVPMNLNGVANMTQIPSNHAKCAARVEVEFHG